MEALRATTPPAADGPRSLSPVFDGRRTEGQRRGSAVREVRAWSCAVVGLVSVMVALVGMILLVIGDSLWRREAGLGEAVFIACAISALAGAYSLLRLDRLSSGGGDSRRVPRFYNWDAVTNEDFGSKAERRWRWYFRASLAFCAIVFIVGTILAYVRDGEQRAPHDHAQPARRRTKG